MRGDGYIQNSWFNTQTVNFLGTLQATPDDRFTVKLINNDLATRLPIRLSLNQFYQNPFQQGCEAAGVRRLRNGLAVQQRLQRTDGRPMTAVQAGLGRNDRRTIVGGRWEHDFDNTTTWRNQFVFDDRNINQPTGSHQRDRRFPVLQLHERRHQARRNPRHGFDDLFRRLLQYAGGSSDTRNVMPGGNATLGLLQSNLYSDTTNYGFRAREELKLTPR